MADNRSVSTVLDFQQDTTATRANVRFGDDTHDAKPLAQQIEQTLARVVQ